MNSRLKSNAKKCRPNKNSSHVCGIRRLDPHPRKLMVESLEDRRLLSVMVTPTSGLVTTEAGGTATFAIALETQPTAEVTIGLASSDGSEGTVSPASVTFDANNWAAPQTVTVAGADDAVVDGNVAYSIVTAVASSAGFQL